MLRADLMLAPHQTGLGSDVVLSSAEEQSTVSPLLQGTTYRLASGM